MRRIDYVLNAKDPIGVLVEEFDLELDCYGCPDYSGCDVCNGNCYNAFIEYLEEDIEVNESNLKDAVVESITIGQMLQSICDIPPQIKINSDKIKEVNTKETLQETLDEVKETLQKTLDKVKEPVENDNVNHPSHYTDGNIEVMDFIEDKQLNFARGNVIKYVSRAGKKDPNKELEDLKKAMWYLNREIERLEKEKK